VSGIRRGLLDSPVNVSTRGGELEIMWDGFKNPNAAVLMRGPTQTVYRGEIDLDTL
jgi:diaminopimelate epimerase